MLPRLCAFLLLAVAVPADTGAIFAGCAQKNCEGQKGRAVAGYYQGILDTVNKSPLSTTSLSSAKYIIPACDTSALQPTDETGITAITQCLSAYPASAAKVVILDLARQQEPVLQGVKLPSQSVFAKWNFKRGNYRPGVDIPFPNNVLDRLLPAPDVAKVNAFPRPVLVSGFGAIEFPKYMQNNSDILLIDQPLNEETVNDYVTQLYETSFSFCASGKNLHARVFEAMKYGNIPVLIDHDIVLPFEEELDWAQFAVFIPFPELNGIVELLQGIPFTKRTAMRELGSFVYKNHFATTKAATNTLVEILGGKSADVKKDFQTAVKSTGGDLAKTVTSRTLATKMAKAKEARKNAQITNVLSGKAAAPGTAAKKKGVDVHAPLAPLGEIPESHRLPEHKPVPVVLFPTPEVEDEDKFVEPNSFATNQAPGAISAFNPEQFFQIDVLTEHPLILSTCNEQTGSELETEVTVYRTASPGQMVKVSGGRSNMDLECDNSGHAKLLLHVTPEFSPYYVSVIGDRGGSEAEGVGCLKAEFQGSKRYRSW
jgi:hypothetical protein